MKNLWDMIVKTPLELYVPEERAYKKVFDSLQAMNVSDLSLKASSLNHLVRNASIRGEAAGTFVETNIQAYVAKIAAPTKHLLISFIAIFLGDRRNLKVYIDTLPLEMKVAWGTLVKNRFVSYEDFTRIIGRECLNRNNRSGWSHQPVLSDEFCWFQLSCLDSTFLVDGKYPKISINISLPYFLQVILIPLYYKEENYIWHTFSSLPDEEDGLHVFNAEKNLFNELIIMNGLKKQKLLVTNDKGKMNVNTLRKLSSQIGLLEFFPAAMDKIYMQLRASFILPVFASCWASEESVMDNPELGLRNLFLSDFLLNYSLYLPSLLSHIGGIRQIDIRDGLFHLRMREFLVFLQKKMTKEWISFDDSFLTYRYEGYELGLLYTWQLPKMNLVNKETNQPVTLDGLYRNLTKPYYKAFIFVLAAFGLVEIALRDRKASDCSPYDSLRYFRLTDLGAYVFDMQESYEVPVLDSCTSLFELDEHNLIIRSLEKDNPYIGLLSEVAESIGNLRYRVTHASLLNSCASKEDVENRIDFFKRYIGNQPPAIWEEFFQSLLNRCNPLKQLPSGKYLVYQLDAGNAELQRLVSTDPLIREYTVRAEGFLLLVEAQMLRLVMNRLKSFGYLLQ